MWPNALNRFNLTRWCKTKIITASSNLFVKHFTNSNFRAEFAINKVEAAAPTESRLPMKSSRNVTTTGSSQKHERSFEIKRFYAAFNEKEIFILCFHREKKWNMNEPIVCEQIWSKTMEIKRKTFQNAARNFSFATISKTLLFREKNDCGDFYAEITSEFHVDDLNSIPIFAKKKFLCLTFHIMFKFKNNSNKIRSISSQVQVQLNVSFMVNF